MFGYLSGTVIDRDGMTITLLIEHTGLGYEILISPMVQILGVNEPLSVWIHHHRTDVSEVLFGFANTRERAIFRQLLRVNGIGGKTALSLLGLGEDTLLRAIELEDDKLLSSVPGIGKKTAQKIIVDLKGSIDFSEKHTQTDKKNTTDATLISSLVGMGYDKSRVEDIVEQIDPSLPIEKRTIEAIRELAR